jgi:hypothetical protein
MNESSLVSHLAGDDGFLASSLWNVRSTLLALVSLVLAAASDPCFAEGFTEDFQNGFGPHFGAQCPNVTATGGMVQLKTSFPQMCDDMCHLWGSWPSGPGSASIWVYDPKCWGYYLKFGYWEFTIGGDYYWCANYDCYINIKTSVAATEGWHQFQVQTFPTTGLTVLSIDGIVVYQTSSCYQDQSLGGLCMYSYYQANCNATYLVDNFSWVPAYPDLVAESITWDRTLGGLNCSYRISDQPIPANTTAKLFWASGTSDTSILSAIPGSAQSIPAGTGAFGQKMEKTFHLDASAFSNPPPGATYVLLVLDYDKLVKESDENNNVKAVGLNPQLVISSVKTPTKVGGLNTFISTDPITLTATVTPPVADVAVHWSVLGVQAARSVFDFPSDEVHNTDSQGISTLLFTPSENDTFVQNRQFIWTTGSMQANPPIQFEVEATIASSGQTISAYLSQTSLGMLEQDETDTLRQEYVDFAIAVPDRTVIVPSLGQEFNNGPYNVQVSLDLLGHYNTILSLYQGRSAVYGGDSFTIPISARVIISNAFRNPRYNKAIGS